MKFTVPVEINLETRELEIIPTQTMIEWLRLHSIYIQTIRFEQPEKTGFITAVFQ